MIKLDDNLKQTLATAVDNLNPVAAAYIDVEGKPKQAFYGSTHAHSDSQLALWIRNPQSSFLKAVTRHPDLSFIYGDVANSNYYMLEGRACITTSPATRERVYHDMHPIERKFDPQQKGVAVIVDLDRITHMSKAGKDVMQR